MSRINLRSFYDTDANEIIHKDSIGNLYNDGSVKHFSVPAASLPAASNTGVHAAITLADGATTAVTTGITNPAVARGMRIKGNAAGITGDVVVEGTNKLGAVISETIAANGANAVDGTKAFETITKITVPARNAEGDTISIGFSDIIGLPYKLSLNTVLQTHVNNALEGTAATVTVSATAIESNTIDPNTALGNKKLDVFLII